MREFDVAIFNFINTLPGKGWMLFFLGIHYLNYIWMSGFSIFLILQNKENKLILPALISAVITYGISTILKLIIDRPRPVESIVDAIVRRRYHLESFPSSHTVVAFSLFAILLIIHPDKWYTWATLAFAICVALSRIYLGAHYPTDVIGGMLLGFFGTILIFKILVKFIN
ncbi:MAG: phosphatase PAP2 family protein [Patescibacteria group bacterium]